MNPFIACSLIVYAAFSVNLAYALTTDETRHLLSRTGFPPSFNEVAPYLTLDKNQAIQKRIATLSNSPENNLPEALLNPMESTTDAKELSREERQAINKLQRKRMQQLKEWWFYELLTSQSPFTENLTLFWHNHFVSSANKVKRTELMARQNQLLRRHSSGNFRTLVVAVLQDPAMLAYLDNTQNRKGKANENLARELMELFTLGEGNYTEQDIREVAKALTGYGIDAKTGTFRFNEKLHDSSHKTIFDQTGSWDADEVVNLILARPQASQFIVGKLWSHFIITPIAPSTLAQLSQQFSVEFEIRPIIKAILEHPDFWAPANIGTQVKDPVKLVVGLYRQFNAKPDNLTQLTNLSSQMGQNLLFAPNVKGWQTGEAWINTNSLLARQAFIDLATRGMKLPDAMEEINQPVDAWLDLLIAKPLQSRIVINRGEPWQSIERALNDPSYQLQ